MGTVLGVAIGHVLGTRAGEKGRGVQRGSEMLADRLSADHGTRLQPVA